YPAFLHLPTPPAVLDATLLGATLTSAVPTPTAVFKWTIDCPTDSNSANDACRDLSIFPAVLWHTQHGDWSGQMIDKSKKGGKTTLWTCDLAGDATLGPHCVDRISTRGAGTSTPTTTLLGCHDDRQLVPLRIREGADKLPEGWEKVVMAEMNEAYRGGLTDTACATTWTRQSGAPTVTRNETLAATTGATKASGQVKETGTRTSGGDGVASQTSEGAGVRKEVGAGLLVVGAAAAAWFGA
ncbi:hypothetical protein V490_07140, partial [Pseudogymnoascus sp. VKM F-3557]